MAAVANVAAPQSLIQSFLQRSGHGVDVKNIMERSCQRFGGTDGSDEGLQKSARIVYLPLPLCVARRMSSGAAGTCLPSHPPSWPPQRVVNVEWAPRESEAVEQSSSSFDLEELHTSQGGSSNTSYPCIRLHMPPGDPAVPGIDGIGQVSIKDTSTLTASVALLLPRCFQGTPPTWNIQAENKLPWKGWPSKHTHP